MHSSITGLFKEYEYDINSSYKHLLVLHVNELTFSLFTYTTTLFCKQDIIARARYLHNYIIARACLQAS